MLTFLYFTTDHSVVLFYSFFFVSKIFFLFDCIFLGLNFFYFFNEGWNLKIKDQNEKHEKLHGHLYYGVKSPLLFTYFLTNSFSDLLVFEFLVLVHMFILLLLRLLSLTEKKESQWKTTKNKRKKNYWLTIF